MANEQLNGKTIEDKKENSRLSRLTDLKNSIIFSLSLAAVPLSAMGQNTVDTTTVHANKSQTEVTKDTITDLKISTIEQLQVFVEQLQPTVEKLQVTVEELQAAIVQLQAAVEQLQTAFDEVTTLLKSNTLNDDEEMPYIKLRSEIDDLEYRIESAIKLRQTEVDRLKAKESRENAENALQLLKGGKE